VAIRNLRNLRRVDLEPGPKLNVISGDNGQGKTNLVEAIYLAATSRSFRTAHLREIVSHGERDASVKLVVESDSVEYEQSVGLRGGTRLLKLDASKPESIVAFASRTPVVAFSPTDVALSMGPGKERRKLLDRVALYTSPSDAAATLRYARALRARQRALDHRGAKASDLDVWEDLVVKAGLETMQCRRRASERLAAHATLAFAEIGAPGLDLEARYVPSAPEDALAYAAALRATRDVDARRGSCAIGPHRDDLVLSLGGVVVRGYASQGQHRAVVLALKAAELAVVAEVRHTRPILLLDDVSSELDRARATALMGFLERQDGQVFVTTTRPELIAAKATERKDFGVARGEIYPA
jgi:DNA replication and repair protein RecF